MLVNWYTSTVYIRLEKRAAEQEEQAVQVYSSVYCTSIPDFEP